MISLRGYVGILLSNITINIHIIPLKCLTITDGCIYISNRYIIVLCQVQDQFATRANLYRVYTLLGEGSILTCHVQGIACAVAEAFIFILDAINYQEVKRVDYTIAVRASELFTIDRTIDGCCVIVAISPCECLTLADNHIFSLLDRLCQYSYIQLIDSIYASILVDCLVCISMCSIACLVMPNDILSIAECSIFYHLYWLRQYGQIQCIYDTIAIQDVLNYMLIYLRLTACLSVPFHGFAIADSFSL